MKRMVVAVIALALVAGATVPAVAQGDVGKRLIGKWEGDIVIPRGRVSSNRTLVIDSVSGQTWKGRFGVTGRGLGRVTGELDTTGPRPVLKFANAAGSRVELSLDDDKTLAGTIHFKGTGPGLQDHEMRLKRVE